MFFSDIDLQYDSFLNYFDVFRNLLPGHNGKWRTYTTATKRSQKQYCLLQVL